jgi:hypothetical protein
VTKRWTSCSRIDSIYWDNYQKRLNFRIGSNGEFLRTSGFYKNRKLLDQRNKCQPFQKEVLHYKDRKFSPCGLLFDATGIYNVQQLIVGLLINNEFKKILGNVWGIIEVLSRHLPGGTEQNHENPESG